MIGPVQRAEADLYTEVWSSLDHYGDLAPGEQWADRFLELVGAGGTVLDAGCGSGKGAIALAARGYHVTCCDLTSDGLTEDARHLPFVDACLWHDLRQAVGGFVDWVYCCDVLEHIPPEFTMLVLRRLLDVARQGVFLSIAFQPDQFGALLGRSLHQTVEPFVWWRDHLRELGDLVDARDLLGFGIFLVRPRR